MSTMFKKKTEVEEQATTIKEQPATQNIRIPKGYPKELDLKDLSYKVDGEILIRRFYKGNYNALQNDGFPLDFLKSKEVKDGDILGLYKIKDGNRFYGIVKHSVLKFFIKNDIDT